MPRLWIKSVTVSDMSQTHKQASQGVHRLTSPAALYRTKHRELPSEGDCLYCFVLKCTLALCNLCVFQHTL